MLYLSLALSGLVAVSASVIPLRIPRKANSDLLAQGALSANANATVTQAVYLTQYLDSSISRIETTVDRDPLSASYRPAAEISGAFTAAQMGIESLPSLSKKDSSTEHYAPLISVLGEAFLSLLDLESKSSQGPEYGVYTAVRAASENGIQDYVLALNKRFPALDCALRRSLIDTDSPAGSALESVAEELYYSISERRC